MIKKYNKWGFILARYKTSAPTYEAYVERDVLVDSSDYKNFNFEPHGEIVQVLGYDREIHSKLKESVMPEVGQVFKYTL